MNPKYILAAGWIFCTIIVIACGPTGPLQIPAPTPTPCATTGAVSNVGTTAVPIPTQVTGRTTPAYPLPTQPTFSPAEQATMQARLQQANPGAPTTASGSPQSLPPPFCTTPTPAK